MAPSAEAVTASQNENITSNNMANDPWNQQNGKENHRPPVFFPEDYIAALKKFSKFASNSENNKSIYDTIDDVKATAVAASTTSENGSIVSASKSRTLPLSKHHSEYK
jgi:hypothetical protein